MLPELYEKTYSINIGPYYKRLTGRRYWWALLLLYVFRHKSITK